jgi:hypothetical protein
MLFPPIPSPIFPGVMRKFCPFPDSPYICVMTNNAVALIRSAKEAALKNRALAVSKAAKPFDEEIGAYDKALRQLGAAPAAKAKTAKKAPAKKKTAPKKKAAAPAKPKAAPAKKAAPKKKAAVKTPVKKAPAAPGTYPKAGTVQEKMSFVIGEAKRFLSIQEVAESIKKHEPAAGALDLIKRRFGKHIDKFRQQGKIVSYLDEPTGKVYYGLPAYLKEGKAVKGHEHEAAPTQSK